MQFVIIYFLMSGACAAPGQSVLSSYAVEESPDTTYGTGRTFFPSQPDSRYGIKEIPLSSQLNENYGIRELPISSQSNANNGIREFKISSQSDSIYKALGLPISHQQGDIFQSGRLPLSSEPDIKYGAGGLSVPSQPDKFLVPDPSMASYDTICNGGTIRNMEGECVYPTITRSIYAYSAPSEMFDYGPLPNVPKPKINYNVIFVGVPESPNSQDPIIVPPAEQQTIVYVLSKDKKFESRKVIKIPDNSRSPEVYYINYNSKTNPKLPGGIDLKDALESANKREGKFINKISVKYPQQNQSPVN